MYEIPYIAQYECAKGHKMTARAIPGKDHCEIMCPGCYQDFLDSLPRAKQVSKAFAEAQSISYLCD